MRTYAEFLNTMTVKALYATVKSLGFKGYSKARKAELISLIDDYTAADHDAAFVLVNDFNEQSVKVEKNVVCMYCGARFATVEASIEHINACNGTVKIADIMAEVALTFSAAPVKAPQIVAKPIADEIEEETTTEDLIYAYQAMRATYRKARGITQVKIGARLRKLSAELKAAKVNMREV